MCFVAVPLFLLFLSCFFLLFLSIFVFFCLSTSLDKALTRGVIVRAICV